MEDLIFQFSVFRYTLYNIHLKRQLVRQLKKVEFQEKKYSLQQNCEFRTFRMMELLRRQICQWKDLG